MKKSWKVYFKQGVPCKWDGDRHDEERENFEFEADLTVHAFWRGCSSAVMILVPAKDADKTQDNTTDLHYQVFMSDCTEVIQYMVNGRVKGIWTFVKKGANFGIKLVKTIL